MSKITFERILFFVCLCSLSLCVGGDAIACGSLWMRETMSDSLLISSRTMDSYMRCIVFIVPLAVCNHYSKTHIWMILNALRYDAEQNQPVSFWLMDKWVHDNIDWHMCLFARLNNTTKCATHEIMSKFAFVLSLPHHIWNTAIAVYMIYYWYSEHMQKPIDFYSVHNTHTTHKCISQQYTLSPYDSIGIATPFSEIYSK